MKRIKLGELLDVRRGTSLSGEYYSESGEYIRITLGNFNYPNGGFKKNTAKKDIYFVGEVSPEFILKKGDIITPLTEQVRGLLGETATIPEDNRYIQSGDVGLIIPNEELLDKRFAYYLINSPIVKKQLDSGAQQTKIRHTSPDTIKDCIVWVPDTIQEQHKISSLLDSLDAQISLNRSIISDLESLAKQIYDYWFVQFDFPDEHGRPYKSSGGQMVWNDKLKRHIPANWEVKTLETVLGIYPKTESIQRADYSLGTKYPIIDQSKAFICGYTDDEKYVLHVKDAIVFGDHTNIAKYINFYFARGADGTQIICSNNPALPNYLLYMQICSLPVIEEGYSRHFKFLKGQYIIIPSLNLANSYMKIVEPIVDKIRDIIQKNRTLTSLRDFLLPMLMNGQVTVK